MRKKIDRKSTPVTEAIANLREVRKAARSKGKFTPEGMQKIKEARQKVVKARQEVMKSWKTRPRKLSNKGSSS